MAWLRSGACAVFVLGAALIGGPVDAAVEFEGCTDECLLAINLARTGKLNSRLSLLVKDDAAEGAARAAMIDNTLLGEQEDNCVLDAALTPVTDHVVGLMHSYAHGAQFACGEFIQAMLDTAMGALANYRQQNWDNGVAAPYNSAAVQNLAYLMFAEAGRVGCARSNNCAAGVNLLLCRFAPSINEDFTRPILSEEFFKALGERHARGIKIQALTKDDLETPLDGKASDKSGGRIGTPPGVLPAAVLTIAALLGFASFH